MKRENAVLYYPDFEVITKFLGTSISFLSNILLYILTCDSNIGKVMKKVFYNLGANHWNGDEEEN